MLLLIVIKAWKLCGCNVKRRSLQDGEKVENYMNNVIINISAQPKNKINRM